MYDTTRRRYQVAVIKDDFWGSFIFGTGNLPEKKLSAYLNKMGSVGWSLDFMIVETRRFLAIFARQAVIVTMSQGVEVPQ